MWGFARLYIPLCLLWAFFSMPGLALAMENSNSMEVTATILPARSVYIKDGVIVKIISNTPGDAEPKFYLLNDHTKEIEASEAIKESYFNIATAHSLSGSGEIYTANTRKQPKPKEPPPRKSVFNFVHILPSSHFFMNFYK